MVLCGWEQVCGDLWVWVEPVSLGKAAGSQQFLPRVVPCEGASELQLELSA